MARKKDRTREPLPTRSVTLSPEIKTEMRGLVQATRATPARRFLTPAQVQDRVNGLLRSVIYEHNKIAERKIPKSEVLATEVRGRKPISESPVLRKNLPAQVRNEFQDVERALECSKRETRREVMFALHRTGKSGKGNRKAKWTWRSRLSCKVR